MSDTQEIKNFVDNLKSMMNKTVSNSNLDKTKKAVVQSFDMETKKAIVKMNNEAYIVDVLPSLSPQINEVVQIKLPQGSMKSAYICNCSTAISASGGTSDSIDWSNIISKPTSIVLDIDDAVVKKHSHNNLSLLETITQTLIDTWNTVTNKVDKVAGKGLSTEDYSSIEKTKLSGIATGANVNVNADWNAVSGDALILNKPSIPTQYTDEQAQDAVGNILTDTSTIDFTYDDTNNQIKADVKSNSIVEKVEISKSGTLIGTRKRINFIEGSNVTMTIADDTTNDDIDVTISASVTGGGDMSKAVYDTTNNGIVDNSEKVNGIRINVSPTAPTVKSGNDLWLDMSS